MSLKLHKFIKLYGLCEVALEFVARSIFFFFCDLLNNLVKMTVFQYSSVFSGKYFGMESLFPAVNPFQLSVAFHIETSHLVCTAI